MGQKHPKQYPKVKLIAHENEVGTISAPPQRKPDLILQCPETRLWHLGSQKIIDV